MKRAAGCTTLNLGHERRGGFHFIESYGQRSETAEAEVFAPGYWLIIVEGDVCGAAGKGFKSQLPLDARQRRAKTEVTGPAESEVPIVCARNVEAIGIGKSLRVAIAGRHDGNYRLAFANQFAADFSVFTTDAGRVLAWALVPQ